jgi:hypothetical protein
MSKLQKRSASVPRKIFIHLKDLPSPPRLVRDTTDGEQIRKAHDKMKEQSSPLLPVAPPCSPILVHKVIVQNDEVVQNRD